MINAGAIAVASMIKVMTAEKNLKDLWLLQKKLLRTIV